MSVSPTQVRWTDKFAARTRSGAGGGLAAILALSGRTDIISFAGGLPDPATMPGQKLVDVVQRVTADPSGLQYAPVKGLPGILDYMTGRLQMLQDRRPADNELMITSGCIEAMELLGKTFLDAGDTVVVEAPTYLGALMGFKSFQAESLAVAMDDDGLQIDRFADAIAGRPLPKLLYTVSDYQNPTGITLSLDRRRQLVEIARDHGIVIVEDVTYRELGFYHDPLPSLWSLAPDTVVQIGTFSKTFFPGVRLGWATGPEEIIAQMVLAKQNTDQCAGALGQRMLEDWGRSGELDRHIALSRSFYRRRRELLIEALQRYMPAGVSWTEPQGGFVCWLTVPGNVDTTDLAARAMEDKVAFVPGSVFFANGRQGHSNLRLSFSSVRDDLIAEGISRLSGLLRRTMAEA